MKAMDMLAALATFCLLDKTAVRVCCLGESNRDYCRCRGDRYGSGRDSAEHADRDSAQGKPTALSCAVMKIQKTIFGTGPQFSASAIGSGLCSVELAPALRGDGVNDDFARGRQNEIRAGRALLPVLGRILIF
jgi:hypothetical protein